MRETGLAALAKDSARGKQYLVLVRPMGEGLAMEQLYYHDEIRDFSEVPLGEGEVKDEELQLAVKLIEQAASTEFRPHDSEDEVRKRMLEKIQHKIDGEEITAVPTAEPQTQIVDLMEALKASLAQSATPAEGPPAKDKATSKTKRKAS
jgi:DNA end-binding protein Ku